MEMTAKIKDFVPTRRMPEEYQPQDRTLKAVRTYAVSQGITSTRVYQRFQEGQIEIVTIDGVQFVTLPKE